MKLLGTRTMFMLWIAHAVLVHGAPPVSNRRFCLSDSLNKNIAPGFSAVRALEDPSSHRGWLVMRYLARPEWPGRVVPLAQQSFCGDDASLPRGRAGARIALSGAEIVIRAGETLIVVEDTKAAHVELAATALGNARRGEVISARLRTGGKLVKMIATGPGRAVLANPSTERDR